MNNNRKNSERPGNRERSRIFLERKEEAILFMSKVFLKKNVLMEEFSKNSLAKKYSITAHDLQQEVKKLQRKISIRAG